VITAQSAARLAVWGLLIVWRALQGRRMNMRNQIGVLALLLGTACGSDGGAGGYTDPSNYPDDGYVTWNMAAAGSGSGAMPDASARVVWASNAGGANYLSDGSGRALYMFANDLPGTNSSACTGMCLEKWPVFDGQALTLGPNLMMSDFTRFARADGTYQTAFKGRPLYRFAADAASSVSGDAVGGRWYVARDYSAFVAAKMDVTPQGATAPTPFMTNRAGRTVYVFMNDTAGTAAKAPSSACADACLAMWPAWAAPAALETMILPSSMKATDFGLFERTVAGSAMKQLTYRGFPLYYHTPDTAPGATSGHMSGAWRAIDPSAFAATK
jgi:predicted lipoprotein with Yx(FWY)xxD motif